METRVALLRFLMQLLVRKFNNHMMFYPTSNHNTMESVLMQDKKLCKKNRVISSPTKYISGICKHVKNTRIKRLLNQNNTTKQLAPLHSMNIHSQNITHLGKNHYTPNAITKSIYYWK